MPIPADPSLPPAASRWMTGRELWARLLGCMKDERGAVMTEYLLVTGIMVPLAAYLFHPDNGFFQAMRNQYQLTNLLLMFPGP
jgi:hypothetical protein